MCWLFDAKYQSVLLRCIQVGTCRLTASIWLGTSNDWFGEHVYRTGAPTSNVQIHAKEMSFCVRGHRIVQSSTLIHSGNEEALGAQRWRQMEWNSGGKRQTSTNRYIIEPDSDSKVNFPLIWTDRGIKL